MWSQAISIAAFLALASAQSLSSKCTSAIASVAANPASACLNPSPLISLFLSGGNTSVVNPINSWLTGLCPAGPCSNDTLAAITTNITTGCQTELGGVSPSQVIPIVQQAYPIVRDVACLKDNNDSGTLCVTQTLKHIESEQGTITVSTIQSWITNGIPSSVASNTVVCTNCIKQAYNVVNQQASGLLGSTADSLKTQCGNSFVDGQTPAGISETASASNSSTGSGSGSGALGLNMPRSSALGGASVLVLISSVFAFLA